MTPRQETELSANRSRKHRIAGLLAAICFLAQSPHCWAAIYKCTGSGGKVTYGDSPCAQDEKAQEIPSAVPPPAVQAPSALKSVPTNNTVPNDRRARELEASLCIVKNYNEWIRARAGPLPDEEVRAEKQIEIDHACRSPLGLPDLPSPPHGPEHAAIVCRQKRFSEWLKAQGQPLPVDKVRLAKMVELGDECRRSRGLAPVFENSDSAARQDSAGQGATSTTATPQHPPASATSADGAVILDLGRLHDGLNSSYASAISADGKVVVGSANHGNYAQVAFRWTRDSEMDALDHSLLRRPSANATAVTRDGSVIVGSWNSEHTGLNRAFRWTETTGMVTLGILPGADRSSASALSVDGQVVVGKSGENAFRWSEKTGMRALPGRSMFGATAVSADGRFVYGDEMDGDDIYIVRWDADGKPTRFPNPPGINASFVSAVTPDGSTMVGQQMRTLGNGGISAEAVAWYTATNQIVHLGSFRGGSSKATAVNSDGTVIVGNSAGGPFRWTKATGMQSIVDWVKKAGGQSPASPPREAMGVSGDGSRVVGSLQNGNPFVAIVPSR